MIGKTMFVMCNLLLTQREERINFVKPSGLCRSKDMREKLEVHGDYHRNEIAAMSGFDPGS